MSVKINNFGGPLVWMLRKYKSNFTSKIMLNFASGYYAKYIDQYIKWFLEQDSPPLFRNVMVETINRCNGECSFCPANRQDEIRPYRKMSDKMYYDVIAQLKNICWSGKLFLCVNNEPLIDKRIIAFAGYAKNQINNIKIVIISNGLLLTPQKIDAMVGVVDQLVINAYSEKYRLPEKHKMVYDYVKNNSDKFSDMSIIINRRYQKEILATRAGYAPNKPEKNNEINASCIYPFTDLVIFPDGKVGMCCNDCREISDFGDITKSSLVDIWNNEKFRNLRMAMRNGRGAYGFCQECDVVDAGEREKTIKEQIKIK